MTSMSDILPGTKVVVISNGDAHLKNWSLLYPDRRTPVLAPAYDILMTQAYIPEESEFALNLNGLKRWYRIRREDFQAWAEAVGIPWPAIRIALDDTMQRAREQWRTLLHESLMLPEHKQRLKTHWQRLQPEWRIE
jgi:serine/threonine-protein kinase HipA